MNHQRKQCRLLIIHVNVLSLGNQLHDVDMRVGETIHNMEFCGHFTGHASTGQRIAVFCPSWREIQTS